MNFESCSYCNNEYNLTNRLPQCFICGRTYCNSCTLYFFNLKGNYFCPACNKFEEISNYDMNIIDELRMVYFCMIHNLPILYSNTEKGFACKACKDEAPNLRYGQFNANDPKIVYEEMIKHNLGTEAKGNIFSIRKTFEEKLKKSKEEKVRKIAEIKKMHKDQKNIIKECLALLEKAERIYFKSDCENQLSLNINLICVLNQEKSKQKSNASLVPESSTEKMYLIDDHIKFYEEKSNWSNLWTGATLYIFFNSFYSNPISSPTVHIKKILRISLNKPLFGGETINNLAGIGFSLPNSKDGKGEYTIKGIYILNQNVLDPIQQNLSPIPVCYDPTQYATYHTLNQQVIFFSGFSYYIEYEYYGSPTYLGVFPSISCPNFSFAEIDSNYSKEYVHTEGQIQYLILHNIS
ncbi:hypothetical protein SteCoe_26967 [Stentor coeruleus]|uniref:RING-type domain-containing protein n=1 Tax=Stentor coeruleus TaxID=5963 RepID=A0A1R2BBP0_9CILI|nr:hypothetical protein SteCoe_26967 [Stentor coeruleus]